MNPLLGYIYHGPTSSGADYHYTPWDIALAALVILPGVVVWVSLFFAVSIQETIADWWARRKARRRARALTLRRLKAQKFQAISQSRWHGKN